MTPLTFVLLVLAALVLICAALTVRAFFRVRGEPLLVDSGVRDLPGSARAQAASVAVGTALNREALNRLKRWYSGRECALCRREIGAVNGAEPRPALLSGGSSTPAIMTWDEILPDRLEAVLDSHQPVCASCALADSFRRRFPERVTDRADTATRDRAYH